jgi:RNA polymerase sigma-70 factor (ECF subfamily)
LSDDSDIVRRLKAGDEQAFETIIDRHYAAMIRLAETFVSDESSAEELVQETWRVVIDKLDTFEGRSKIKTWIFGILANLARERRRSDQREKPWSTIMEESIEESAGHMTERFDAEGRWQAPPRSLQLDPEDEAMTTQLLQRVQAAMEELPARQRAAVMLRDVQGLSSGETCEILDVTKANQRVLLHRGRSKIREALEEAAVVPKEVRS